MGEELTIPIAFLAGLISFLSPCVLPLVPPYISYLAGTTLNQLTEGQEIPRDLQRRVAVTAILFVMGFTTVFVLLGASASVLGQLLVTNLGWLSQVAGVIIILMGLHFLGLFRIPLLYREVRYNAEVSAGTLLGAYVMGLAFAFGWTPCIGPVLAAILFVAASRETVGEGMMLLAVYSLGIGIPFLASAFAVKPFLRFMRRFRRHLGKMEKVMGGLLVAAGILFITGAMAQFSFWLLETFPVFATIG